MTGTTIRLKKIEAGRYETLDVRFEIRNTYDPSGPPHSRYAGMNWLMIDTEARAAGEKSSKYLHTYGALSDARWHLGLIYERIAK